MGTPNDYEGRVDPTPGGEISNPPSPLTVEFENSPFTRPTRVICIPVVDSNPGDKTAVALDRGLEIITFPQPKGYLGDIQRDAQTPCFIFTKVQNQRGHLS